MTQWKYEEMDDIPGLVVALRETAALDGDAEEKVFHLNCATAIEGLLGELKTLQAALNLAVQGCPCSPRERMSGHKTDCFVPEVLSILGEVSSGE